MRERLVSNYWFCISVYFLVNFCDTYCLQGSEILSTIKTSLKADCQRRRGLLGIFKIYLQLKDRVKVPPSTLTLILVIQQTDSCLLRENNTTYTYNKIATVNSYQFL